MKALPAAERPGARENDEVAYCNLFRYRSLVWLGSVIKRNNKKIQQKEADESDMITAPSVHNILSE